MKIMLTRIKKRLSISRAIRYRKRQRQRFWDWAMRTGDIDILF